MNRAFVTLFAIGGLSACSVDRGDTWVVTEGTLRGRDLFETWTTEWGLPYERGALVLDDTGVGTLTIRRGLAPYGPWVTETEEEAFSAVAMPWGGEEWDLSGASLAGDGAAPVSLDGTIGAYDVHCIIETDLVCEGGLGCETVDAHAPPFLRCDGVLTRPSEEVPMELFFRRAGRFGE